MVAKNQDFDISKQGGYALKTPIKITIHQEKLRHTVKFTENAEGDVWF